MQQFHSVHAQHGVAGIPMSMYEGYTPPELEDGVVTLAGTPIMWNTLSTYCGHYPPSTLDLNGVINWLDQKTSKPPCRLDLEDEENALRYSEYSQMRSLKMVLQARRMMLA